MLQSLQQALSTLGLQLNLFEHGRGQAQRELAMYNADVTKVVAKLLDHGLFRLRSTAEMVLQMFPSRKEELRDLFAKESGSLKGRPLPRSKGQDSHTILSTVEPGSNSSKSIPSAGPYWSPSAVSVNRGTS